MRVSTAIKQRELVTRKKNVYINQNMSHAKALPKISQLPLILFCWMASPRKHILWIRASKNSPRYWISEECLWRRENTRGRWIWESTARSVTIIVSKAPCKTGKQSCVLAVLRDPSFKFTIYNFTNLQDLCIRLKAHSICLCRITRTHTVLRSSIQAAEYWIMIRVMTHTLSQWPRR